MNCEDCRLGKPLYYRDGQFGHEWHGNNLAKCAVIEQFMRTEIDLPAIIAAVEKYDPEGDILTAIGNMHDTIALLDQKKQFWKSTYDTQHELSEMDKAEIETLRAQVSALRTDQKADDLDWDVVRQELNLRPDAGTRENIVKAIRSLRADLNRVLKQEVWRWQDDGEDFPDSLSCPVLVQADVIRRWVRIEQLDAVRAELNK